MGIMDNLQDEYAKHLQSQLKLLDGLEKKDRDLILDFYERHLVKKGLSNTRRIRVLIILRQFSKEYGLAKANEKTLERFNIQLMKDKRSKHTVHTIKAVLKCYFRFKDNPLFKSPELKAQNPYLDPAYKLKTSDLLTPAEIASIIRASDPKSAAFVALLYGSGARIGGLRFLKRADCKFDAENGLTIDFVSKGTANSVWVRPDLALIVRKWFNESPFKDPQNYLFTNPRGQACSNAALHKRIKIAAKKAGLTKPVWPHLFRHVVASELMNAGVPSQFIKTRLWGRLTSRQLEVVYGHMDKAAEKKAYMAAYGLVPKEEPQHDKTMDMRLCFACGKTNSFDTPVCVCGMDLANTPEQFKAKVNEREFKLAAMEEQMRAVMAFMKTNGG